MVEDVITKPEAPAPFNFGPASERDEIVYSCERPGGNKKNDIPQGTPEDEIEEWLVFMKEKNVKRDMVLLDENELIFYKKPLFEILESNGIKPIHLPMKSENAAANAYKALKEAKEANEKIVVHCTGGKGRAARVLSYWLVKEYGLTPQEATDEVIESAKKYDLIRLGNAEKLEKWMNLYPQ